jgi:hypothetical protein
VEAGEERWMEREAAPGWFFYLRDDALVAGKTLGELVRAKLVEGAWRASTCVPAFATPARLEQYGSSVMGWPETRNVHGPDPNGWIAERVVERLGDNGTGTLVIPDVMAHFGDPNVGKMWNRYTTYGDEIYLVLPADQATPDLVQRALNAASNAWMEVAMITTAIVPDRRLTSDDLNVIADRTVGILATAYDSETWLLAEQQPPTGRKDAFGGT